MSTETKPAEWALKAADDILENGFAPRESLQFHLAAIIAKHAPAQGVNERLLDAARRAAAILPPHFGNPDRTAFELDAAIAEAESAPPQPARIESEAIEALRRLEKQFAIKCEATCMFADDLGAIEEARAILARHDQK